MPDDRPGFYALSHVTTTEPRLIPTDAVVRIGSRCTHQAALEQAMRENYDLRTELAKREATIAKLDAVTDGDMDRLLLAHKEIASLRSQFARAGAIEAKAKELAACDRPSATAGMTQVPSGLLNDLEGILASPGPEVAKPAKDKYPHCGTHFGPENLTCGECGRWLAQAAKPSPVIDAAARLAILERVAKAAKDFFRGRSEDPTDDVYTLFRLAVADLIAFEEAL